MRMKILVTVKNEMPYIDDLRVTFATKEIRDEIESICTTNDSFYLPAKYTYEKYNSIFRGTVARIYFKSTIKH